MAPLFCVRTGQVPIALAPPARPRSSLGVRVAPISGRASGMGPAVVVAALDAVRARALRGLVPVSSVLAARRELRVAVIGSASIAFAFLLAVGAPLWTLALGPIVLGVPHLLADVRYCIVRPGWHRRAPLVVAVGVPLLLGSILSDPTISLAAVAGAAAAAEGRAWRRFLVLALAAAAMLAMLNWRGPSQLALVHAHNLVAIGLWWAWRRRRTRLHALPLLLFVGLSALLFIAAPVPGLHDAAPARLDLQRHLAELAPGLSVELGARVVLLFCFAQAVHYAIWLRMVPDEDRDRATPRTFGQSLRALRRELGRPVLVVTALVAGTFAVWAVVDLAHARTSYLRFGMFHVTLELCAAALLFIEGRPVDRRPAPHRPNPQDLS